MKLDIGEIIRQEFEKSGLSISQFARMINKERTVVYNLFKRQSIDTHLLYQICMVLNVDLFRVFSECLGEENKVIGADRVNELQTTSSKRKVMLEVELDDMEYDRIMQKMFEKKKDLSR
ncbi:MULTISPECIES: helix-turn-helix transcriptional regulator [Butyricimonas]|jgi:putative DNA-binding protein|uniref:Helix-turn-helix transcriptional regulator n=1 Tax=Butyricimonas hominis TaxID=2763032 RepID=A0ABR7D1P5_9BACT|nr:MULTISPECIES: helix-turn-helix transcriptional regulator [Butyricimonas]MBC5621824.1 helix-turn-helix transcriptional regulator [Butyricimonas hominis]